MNNRTVAIAAAILLLGALAACSGSPRGRDAVGNPDGASSDLVADMVSGDQGRDRVPDRDIVLDAQPETLPKDTGLHDADVASGQDNDDGGSQGDLFDLDTTDSGPPDLLPDVEPDGRPDLEPSDLDTSDQQEDVEVEEPYDCPTGQDGKKELMPDCPYDAITCLAGCAWSIPPPIQLEIYTANSNPGLPVGFVATEGQSLALLRFYWKDLWTEFFVTEIGCPPEWPGCKACGGHCFPPQGYVHVIDLATLNVIYSAKEDLPPDLFSAEHCKNPDGSNSILCYELKLPESAIKMALLIVGQWHTGTSNVIPDLLRVYNIDAGGVPGVVPEVLKYIPIPLL